MIAFNQNSNGEHLPQFNQDWQQPTELKDIHSATVESAAL